ncbi:MAG TPA: aminoacyl-tRNA hydrolase [Polyangiaceae bacterium]
MFLVVGLGNPGREHEKDRHNVGFMVVDDLRRAEGWPDFRARPGGVWTRGELGGMPVVLLQPQTYMNRSGDCVQPTAAFFKVPPERLVVVHDELDLPWGDVRLKAGGGHAGHNGLRSILERLGAPDFVRVRVGIGRPPPGLPGQVADWVLSGFDAVERAELPAVVTRAADAVRRVVADGLPEAMKAVNTRA